MKSIILSLLLVTSFFLNAQTSNLQLVQGEHVILYSLPTTALKVVVEYEKTEQKPGSLFQYSERYLATKQFITEEKDSYKLLSVKVVPVAMADANRTFSIQPVANSVLNFINVNEQGILQGVNLGLMIPRPKMPHSKDKVQSPQVKSNLLPLSEEYMMAGSMAKMAEGAAKQIYRIRESRLALLTGDLEHMPADGKSFDTMLKSMNDLEKHLTELFVGSVKNEVLTQEIQLLPQASMDNNLLFRFSAFKGIVAANDLSGSPIFISIQPTVVEQAPANPKSKPEPVGLYTVLPAKTNVSISDGVNTFFNAQFDMPQFGQLVSLSQSMFAIPKDKSELVVRVDEKTGRLISVGKK